MMSELILRSPGKGMVVRQLFAVLWLVLALSGARDVFAIPVISTNPVSVYASTGQTVTFAVAVSQMSNTPPLFVQWRRTGANIPGALTTFSNVPGTAFLTISNAQATDAGSYHATVFDADAVVNTTNVNLFITNLTTLAVGTVFANRGFIYLSCPDSGSADNFSSTNEPGTPNNNNIPGGSMVWLEGYASSSGIVTVDTRGSDFDTTVGIYSNRNNFATGVSNLVSIIGDDDSGDYFNSAVSFNVTYGNFYEIGINGYYANRGHIVLNWSFETTTNYLPIIIQQPQSQTTLSNATVSLFVVVATNIFNTSPQLYQWYFNGTPITNATQSSLTITNVFTTVGQYRMRVQFSNESTNYAVMSQTANIQINLQGNTHAAAQFKLQQAADPNSYPGGPVPAMQALAIGFTGTQIYNAGSSRSMQADMPPFCSTPGGSTTWYSVLATNTGTFRVDANTTYTNVLCIFTLPPGDSNPADLIPIACEATNRGVGHEIAFFNATSGTTYYIVVAGVDGEYGPTTLTLSNLAAPTIITNPQSQTVHLGDTAALTVSAIGSPSPALQWRTNNVKYGGQTATLLTIPNFQAVNQGNYDVVVTNLAGSVTSAVATLYLDSPLRFTNYVRTTTNSFNFLLLGKAGTNYIIQATTNLATTNWIPIYTNLATYGLTFYADTNMRSDTNRFFRATIKTN